MALAININDLLNKQKIESNRIEFKKESALKTALQTAPESALQTALESGLESRLESGLKSGLKILEHIQNNPQSTLVELAKQTGYSRSWVAETMKRLQEQGIIKRIGSDKSGYWVIVDKDEQ